MTEQDWLTGDDPAAMLHAIQGPEPAWGGFSTRKAGDRKLRLFAAACCRSVWDRLTDPRGRRAVEVAEWYADWSATEGERAFAERQRAFAERQAWATAERQTWAVGADPPWRPTYAAALAIQASNLFDAAAVAYQTRRLGCPPAAQAAILRDLFGNPWKPVRLSETVVIEQPCPDCEPSKPDEDCDDCGGTGTVKVYLRESPRLLTPDVRGLARAAYENRADAGHLDPARLAVLADALEEGGCTSEELLRHLRGQGREPGTWCRCRRCGVVYAGANKYSECDSVGCEGEPYDEVAKWRDTSAPHFRGCWALDTILGLA